MRSSDSQTMSSRVPVLGLPPGRAGAASCAATAAARRLAQGPSSAESRMLASTSTQWERRFLKSRPLVSSMRSSTGARETCARTFRVQGSHSGWCACGRALAPICSCTPTGAQQRGSQRQRSQRALQQQRVAERHGPGSPRSKAARSGRRPAPPRRSGSCTASGRRPAGCRSKAGPRPALRPRLQGALKWALLSLWACAPGLQLQGELRGST